MVLSLRDTLPAMASDLDELDKLEVASKKGTTTTEQARDNFSNVITKMDRIILKLELLYSKVNINIESDEETRFMASMEQPEHHHDTSRLDRIEALIAARNHYESSCLDRIETTIAAMMRQSSLADELISLLTTRNMSSNSTVDPPAPSLQPVSQSDITISQNLPSPLCFDGDNAPLHMNSEMQLVSKQRNEIADPIVASSAATLFVPEVAAGDHTITYIADSAIESSIAVHEFIESQKPHIMHEDGSLLHGFNFSHSTYCSHNWAQVIAAQSKPLQCTSICPIASFFHCRNGSFLNQGYYKALAVAYYRSTHDWRLPHGLQFIWGLGVALWNSQDLDV